MKTCPRVLLVHPGIQHAPRLAEALEREGLLARFWTGWVHTGGAGGKRSVAIPDEKLRTRPWVEWAALLLGRAGMDGERVWHWRNTLFQKLIPDAEIRRADVVVGFDTAGWILARRAKQTGKPFILEQSIAHPAARAEELKLAGCGPEVWPEAFQPRLPVVAEAEREEHELADVVVAASSFTRKTLIAQGFEEKKIRVLPYGVAPEFLEAGQRGQARPEGGKMRFLFLGHLSARKGLRQLLEAWKGVEGGELVLMGGGDPGPWKKVAGANVYFPGGGNRARVLEEMKKADVFVFPSLFEGFGLVLLEAMAAGLPVITTQNTGGPDVIHEGKEGFIVPAGSVGALRGKIKWFIQNPEQAKEMCNAAHKIAKNFTWEKYSLNYREVVLNISQTLKT